MAIDINPNALQAGFDINTINDNFIALKTALDRAHSRYADSPNAMMTNLDMNGFRILNQANPVVLDAFNWRGTWATDVQYAIGDAVFYNSSSYLCGIAHLSQDFLTDLLSSDWQVIDLGLKYKGDWTSTTDYFIGDLVISSNQFYYCIANHVSGVTFSPTNWIEYGEFGSMAAQNADDVDITGGLIENVILNNCLCNDPTVDLQVANKSYVDNLIPPGMMMPRFSALTSVPLGWINYQLGSIGNAASGATIRANDDTVNLFTLLWNDFNNTLCPVSGGRGASADADFAANKTISITDGVSRVMGVAGTPIGGLSTRTSGQIVGEENHILTIPEIPSHNHGVAGGGLGNNDLGSSYQGGSGVDQAAALTSGSTGGGDAHNNMQPTIFYPYFIKL
jgi:hypothetical protein